jgi:hypothetical protein
MCKSSGSTDLLAHIPSRHAVCECLQQQDEHLVVVISRRHLHVFLVSSAPSVSSTHATSALAFVNLAAQKSLVSVPSSRAESSPVTSAAAACAAACAVLATSSSSLEGFITTAEALAPPDPLDAAVDALAKSKPALFSTSEEKQIRSNVMCETGLGISIGMHPRTCRT